MSAASWFNPKMLPYPWALQHGSHTHNRLFCFFVVFFFASFFPPAAHSRDHRYRNRTRFIIADAPAKALSFPFNLPLVIHALQPLNAEQVTKCFSAEYGFHLSRALAFVDSDFPSVQPNCLKLQMLNIAQVSPPPHPPPTSWYLPLLTMRLFLRRCMVPSLATVSAALFALLPSCYLLLFIVAWSVVSKEVCSCGSWLFCCCCCCWCQ